MAAAICIALPYSALGPWEVRKGAERLGSYDSAEEAHAAALDLSIELARQLGRQVRLSIQKADGNWWDPF